MHGAEGDAGPVLQLDIEIADDDAVVGDAPIHQRAATAGFEGEASEALRVDGGGAGPSWR